MEIVKPSDVYAQSKSLTFHSLSPGAKKLRFDLLTLSDSSLSAIRAALIINTYFVSLYRQDLYLSTEPSYNPYLPESIFSAAFTDLKESANFEEINELVEKGFQDMFSEHTKKTNGADLSGGLARFRAETMFIKEIFLPKLRGLNNEKVEIKRTIPISNRIILEHRY